MDGRKAFDEQALEELDRFCRLMSPADLRQMCAGLLKAAARTQRVLRERFPEEWVRFDADVDGGRL